MDPSELQRYLYEHIPMSAAMGVSVLEASTQTVRLAAPLDLNINHHRTAFGGSISTLATLACWSHAHLLMRKSGNQGSLVIQRHEIDYLRPITGDFEAFSLTPDREDVERFFDLIDSKGKGRIGLQAEVRFGDLKCAAFRGQFVALVEPKIG